MTTNQNQQSTATLLHLSQMLKYFIPFAGIVVPMIIWSTKKNESKFLDDSGKSVINFNISMMIYFLISILILAIGLVILGINFAIETENLGEEIFPVGLVSFAVVGIFILGFACLVEFILTIIGALKASNGEVYEYPITIKFLK